MDIRGAVRSDIGELAALWCEAFPGSRSPGERAHALETGGPYGGLESVLVARAEDGSLAGGCKLYRLTQRIAGVAFPAMGLAAVAVAPGQRRRGLGASLCTRAMEVARGRGDVVSSLYPFRPDYYERLGWGLVGELRDHRFRTADLPAYPEARHVRPAEPADAGAIAACYARVAAGSNGLLERDERMWGWRLADEELGVREAPAARPGGLVMVHDRAGVQGYAILRALAPRGTDAPRVHVRELIADTEEAYRGLLGWLAGQAARWPVARHTARPAERFEDRLRDPRPPGARRARGLYFPTGRVIRGPMLRLLDVPRAFMLRHWFDAAPDRAPDTAVVEVRVSDDRLPVNDGRWRVRIEGGRATLGGRGGVDAAMSAGASTLARLFAGELAPTEAARLGRAALDGDASLLDGAFATRDRFWLLDEF